MFFYFTEDVRILRDHLVVLSGDLDELFEVLVAFEIALLKFGFALVESSDKPAQGKQRGTERTERAGEDLQPLGHFQPLGCDRGQLTARHAGEHDGRCGEGVGGDGHG